jgi:hypothetical protein
MRLLLKSETRGLFVNKKIEIAKNWDNFSKAPPSENNLLLNSQASQVMPIEARTVPFALSSVPDGRKGN